MSRILIEMPFISGKVTTFWGHNLEFCAKTYQPPCFFDEPRGFHDEPRGRTKRAARRGRTGVDRGRQMGLTTRIPKQPRSMRTGSASEVMGPRKALRSSPHLNSNSPSLTLNRYT